jgi:hypothetical protein
MMPTTAEWQPFTPDWLDNLGDDYREPGVFILRLYSRGTTVYVGGDLENLRRAMLSLSEPCVLEYGPSLQFRIEPMTPDEVSARVKQLMSDLKPVCGGRIPN